MHPISRWYLLLVWSGIAVLAVVQGVLQVTNQDFIFPDSTTYLQAAKNLYTSFTPHDTRPIFLALLNGFPLLFGFGDESVFVWSYFLNAACWIGTALLLFSILRNWLSDKPAFLISLVHLLTMGSAVMVFHLLSESIYTFLLFLVVFLLFRYEKTKHFTFLSWALALLVLLILVRPGAKVLAILTCLYLAKTVWKNRQNRSLIWVGLALAAVCLQLGMMKKQFGHYTISYIDSFTYYNYLGTRAQCLRDSETFKQCDNGRYRYFITLDYDQQKKVAVDDLKGQLEHNTANVIGAYFINVFQNSIGGSTPIAMCEQKTNLPFFEPIKFAMKSAAKLQNIGFSLLALLLCAWAFMRQRAKVSIFVSAVFITVSIALYGISSDQGDRFHLVLYPMILMLAGRWLSLNCPKWKK